MPTQADEPIFFQRQDRLSLTEAGYFQDLLYRTVKIGTELEFALPKGVRRENFQPGIEKRHPCWWEPIQLKFKMAETTVKPILSLNCKFSTPDPKIQTGN